MRKVKIVISLLAAVSVISFVAFHAGRLSKSTDLAKFQLAANLLLHDKVKSKNLESAEDQIAMQLWANLKTIEYLKKFPFHGDFNSDIWTKRIDKANFICEKQFGKSALKEDLNRGKKDNPNHSKGGASGN